MRLCNGRAVSFFIVLIVFSLSVIFQIGSAQATDKTIKIGVIGPMKFMYGDHPWKGAQMAAGEINAAGGVEIKGVPHKIELFRADDNCLTSVPDAISAMERLVTVNKVDAVIGGYRSETVLAQQEIAADNKTLFIGIGGGTHPELAQRVAKDYDRYKYYFRGWVDATDCALVAFAQTSAILSAVKSELGIEKPKVALLMDKAKWADPIVGLAKALFPKMGCEVVGTWRHGFAASNVTAELNAIKRAGAQVIFHVAAGPAGNVIARQWGELEIPAALVGINSEGFKRSQWKATSGFCDYMTNAVSVGRAKITEKTIPFFDAYHKRYGEDPDLNVCLGYDNLYVIKEAMERAGTLESDAVVAEMEKTNSLGTTGIIAYNPRDHKRPHDTIWGSKYTPILVAEWRDGKQTVVWPDGLEVNPAVRAFGAPSGWEGTKFEGTAEYKLPPWMIKYWESKK